MKCRRLSAVREQARQIIKEKGHITSKMLKRTLTKTFVTMARDNSSCNSGERLSRYGFPSDRTLERWLKNLANSEEWNQSSVTVERRGRDRGGGATWILVYYLCDLDEATVRTEYFDG